MDIEGKIHPDILNIGACCFVTDSFHVHRRLDRTLHQIVNYYTDVNLSRTMQRETT